MDSSRFLAMSVVSCSTEVPKLPATKSLPISDKIRKELSVAGFKIVFYFYSPRLISVSDVLYSLRFTHITC